jgi:VIT1/CCC1 family predicted Fe2+/Mn2+ transporter
MSSVLARHPSPARCKQRGYRPPFGTVPIATLLVAPAAWRIPAIAALSLMSLAALGAFGGRLGGAPLGRAALRVIIGGALAMAVTAAIGRIFGVALS